MRSVTLKSAMTPSFMGRMATMLPGVRPSISLASLPTASTSPVFLLMATMEGSLTTMPLPLAYTSVLAVPRSMARSDEKTLNSDLRLCSRVEEWNPLDDIRDLALSNRCHCRAYPVASVRVGGRAPILWDNPRFALKPKSRHLGCSCPDLTFPGHAQFNPPVFFLRSLRPSLANFAVGI